MSTIDYTAELGKRFVTLLEEDLTPEQFEEVRTRNDAREPGVCHSHDFIDANETMDQAFRDVLGRHPQHVVDCDTDATFTRSMRQHTADNTLWSAAWDWAIEHYLSHSRAATALDNAGYPEVRS